MAKHAEAQELPKMTHANASRLCNTKVRKFADAEGQEWFLAADLSKALGLTNNTMQVNKVDPTDKMKIGGSVLGLRPSWVWLVTEAGALQILDKNRLVRVKKAGKEFRENLKTCASDVMGPLRIYTDGACSGNPGPGGWGVVWLRGDENNPQKAAGGAAETTNNRMELMAAIVGLESLEEAERSHTVVLVSDSRYVVDGISKGWAVGWRKKGWRKGDGKPVLNADLWQRLLVAVESMEDVRFQWVKGHAGDVWNTEADRLAVSGIPVS